MSTIRFHRSIYFPDAIAEGVTVFADYGRLEVDDSDSNYVSVSVAADDAGRQEALEGAFANYVLGASVHAHQEQAG